MKRRRHRSHLRQPAEVNITAFMNLMVVLVPFLLITAVFSRITVLNLDVPTASATPQPEQDPPELQLEVIVRRDAIEVGDSKLGLLERVAADTEGNDLQQVSTLLQEIKARYPDHMQVSLLLEPDIAYDRVIELMDTLRVAPVIQDGKTVYAALFPSIAIGDAPPASPEKIGMVTR